MGGEGGREGREGGREGKCVPVFSVCSIDKNTATII